MHLAPYTSTKEPVLPHKLYKMADQTIAEIAFKSYSRKDRKNDIEKILATLEEYLFLNMARVLTPNHDATKLHIRYAHGISKENRFINYDIDQGITGLIYSSRQAIYADDLDTNSMYLGKLGASSSLPHINPAITGVPIIDSKNNIKGVLCVNHGFREANELSEIISVLENTAILLSSLIK